MPLLSAGKIAHHYQHAWTKYTRRFSISRFASFKTLSISPRFDATDGTTGILMETGPHPSMKYVQWPFFGRSEEFMAWLTEAKAEAALFTGSDQTADAAAMSLLSSEDESRRLMLQIAMCFLLHKQHYAAMLKYPIRVVHQDLVDTSLKTEPISESARSETATSRQISLYHLSAVHKEKLAVVAESSGQSYKIRYEVTQRLGNDQFQLIQLKSDNATTVLDSSSIQSVFQYFQSRSETETEREERSVIISSLRLEETLAIQRLAPQGVRIHFAPMQFIRNMYQDVGSDTAVLRSISNDVQLSGFVNKLRNLVTHFNAFARCQTAKESAPKNPCFTNSLAHKECFVFFTIHKELIVYHINPSDERINITQYRLHDSLDDFQKCIVEAKSPHFLFLNAARTIVKFPQILQSLVAQNTGDTLHFWCISFAEVLQQALRGTFDVEVHLSELSRDYGAVLNPSRMADTDDSANSGVSSEILHVLRVFECYQQQSLYENKDSFLRSKVHKWVSSLLNAQGNPLPLHVQSVLSFRQCLLRGFVPKMIPVDFQHCWRWFDPNHLLTYYFGGPISFGKEALREQSSASRPVSHVIVEMAKKSDTLQLVSETHLRHYARRHKISLSSSSSIATAISSTMDNMQTAQSYRIVVYDMETTGLDTVNDRIVEIGFWDPVTDATYETFVNPEMAIPAAVTRIHGITDEDVQHSPTWSGVAQSIVSFFTKLRGDTKCEVLLLAHNSKKLDQHLLQRQFREANIELPSFVHSVDSLPMLFQCKKRLPEEQIGNLRLSHLVDQFGIEVDGALHRAVTDAKSLWGVIEILATKHAQKHLEGKTSIDKKAKELKESLWKWEKLRRLPSSERTNFSEAERRAIGHSLVVTLMGHSIEENIAGKLLNEDKKVDHKAVGLSLSLPSKVDVSRIFKDMHSDALRDVSAEIARMRFMSSQAIPEQARFNFLCEFIRHMQPYSKRKDDDDDASPLLLSTLELITSKHLP